MALFPASYSKLSTYETCARKAYYRYIEKLEDKKSKQMERGTTLHSSAEGYLLGEKNTIHRELQSIGKVLKYVRSRSPMVETKMALSRGLEEIVPWESSLAWFRLVIDCLYLEKTACHIQEWKSGKQYDDHADQRNIYGMASLIKWPDLQEAHVVTHYIDLNKKVPVQIDRTRAMLLQWHLTERLEVMEKDKVFAPRPGYYCGWCSFSKLKGGPCKVG